VATVGQMFRASVYIDADTGEIPASFEGALIAESFT
jgi:hypothetical protein